MNIPTTVPASATSRNPASSPTKTRLRVGVVDDDGHFLEATCFLMELSGFKVEPFLDVEAFLNADATQRLDCLVLDVALPDIDGPSLYKSLRASGLKIPIIFCSGMSPEEIAERGFAVEDVTMLRKPVHGRQLEHAIRAACEKAALPPSDFRPPVI